MVKDCDIPVKPGIKKMNAFYGPRVWDTSLDAIFIVREDDENSVRNKNSFIHCLTFFHSYLKTMPKLGVISIFLFSHSSTHASLVSAPFPGVKLRNRSKP